MYKRLSFFLFFLFSLCGHAQNKYLITLDLNNISNDRVRVTIIPPRITDKEIHYVMPSYIPGSYFSKDFGRFVSEMYVVTRSGNSLDIKKDGENIFVIKNKYEEEIAKIEYYISDSWDMEKPSGHMSDAEFNYVFQPGGTNISAGQNFVINHYGFFGYIDGYKDLPYEIVIQKPPSMYATTMLSRKKGSVTRDYFFAENYTRLVDNPIMYCIPDTIGFNLDNVHISISVYSENGLVKSKSLLYCLMNLTSALQKFLGKIPVQQYSFMMFFASPNNSTLTRYGGYGAMEHNYCSFYFLPELTNEDSLISIVRQFVPHNFMHILTPLNIHSDIYEKFDFKHVPQSRHIWMYEGVTEYLSYLLQVKDSLMSKEQFINLIHEKIDRSKNFPSVSMTDMGLNLNKKINKESYMNVFDKGAVIAFMMDMKLTELSHGQLELKDVLLRLSDKYGPDKSFKDDTFFDEFVQMTFPEMRGFIDDYLVSNKPLPYKEYFEKIGMNYFSEKIDTTWSFGKFTMMISPVENKLRLLSVDAGNLLGLQKGDLLISVNGKEIDLMNFEEIMAPIYQAQNADKVNVVFVRGMEIRNSDASPIPIIDRKTNVIIPKSTVSELQNDLYKEMLRNRVAPH